MRLAGTGQTWWEEGVWISTLFLNDLSHLVDMDMIKCDQHFIRDLLIPSSSLAPSPSPRHLG